MVILPAAPCQLKNLYNQVMSQYQTVAASVESDPEWKWARNKDEEGKSLASPMNDAYATVAGCTCG